MLVVAEAAEAAVGGGACARLRICMVAGATLVYVPIYLNLGIVTFESSNWYLFKFVSLARVKR